MLHAIAAKRKFSPYKLPTPITTKTMLECLSYSMVSARHCSLTREPASTCSLYMYTRKSNYRVPSRSLRPHVSTHTAAANLSRFWARVTSLWMHLAKGPQYNLSSSTIRAPPSWAETRPWKWAFLMWDHPITTLTVYTAPCLSRRTPQPKSTQMQQHPKPHQLLVAASFPQLNNKILSLNQNHCPRRYDRTTSFPSIARAFFNI